MPGNTGTISGGVLFQSAPGREAGRCPRATAPSNAAIKFQSAPGREAGRCVLCSSSCVGDGMFQSAPGREAGRCLSRALFRKTGFCFNPRPAVRPGDARLVGRHIHLEKFQSAPGREAGRCALVVVFVMTKPDVSIRARP